MEGHFHNWNWGTTRNCSLTELFATFRAPATAQSARYGYQQTDVFTLKFSILVKSFQTIGAIDPRYDDQEKWGYNIYLFGSHTWYPLEPQRVGQLDSRLRKRKALRPIQHHRESGRNVGSRWHGGLFQVVFTPTNTKCLSVPNPPLCEDKQASCLSHWYLFVFR